MKTYDVAVIGAGSFGAWTAHHLQRRGLKVALLDAYGAANSRSSSGGETRVIRVGYGADEIYARWAMQALELWKEFFKEIGQQLFQPTGVLWMATGEDDIAARSLATLKKLGAPHERLSRPELEKRFPQIALGPVTWGLLETKSGLLLARRAVQAVTADAAKNGVDYFTEAVVTPSGRGKLAALNTGSARAIHAGKFVFACGPWLPKLFPELLRQRIFPTRQEVFFFAVPPGDRRFAPPALPVWFDFGNEVYGLPDIENRGMKVAFDRHGPPVDPDTEERIVTAEGLRQVRKFLAERFPDLKDAPVAETRVCQYENTSNGDFLIDRHPDFENVWLVGGGSGHGFKHGPVIGEYVAKLLTEGVEAEPRFSLATKSQVRQRSVF